MVFSLQRRFLVFLLLPVALILIAVGIAGFFFARGYLLEQWQISTKLILEKSSHQISMALDEKLELIRLIGRAEDIPGADLTGSFLIQQLAQVDGVRFVDVEWITGRDRKTSAAGVTAEDFDSGAKEGLYTMEVCEDFGFCAPVMDPNALDRSLRIVKILAHKDDGSVKRLLVRISFDSFLQPLTHMSHYPGSTAALVTSTGQFLSATDRAFADRRRLGDNGDPLEKQVLKEIKTSAFGQVFGEGHPPDRVIGFYKVPSMNWYILMMSSGDEILGPIVSFRHYYAAAGLLALALVLCLIRLATRSVAQSISDIARAAARVRSGDYDVKLSEIGSDEIGQLRGSFNAMIEGLKERDLIEQTFGRYVDKKVAEELMSRPEALRLGGEQRTVTIMMSDLRDFTPMSEKLTPEQVIKMLNRYFSRMIAVIEKYRGIIVDFYGDSILVFFNGVETDIPGRASDAVKCALEMQQALEGFKKDNLARGLPEVEMGIGIHTGEVIVGNIGTESRAKYGIVGANVNLTDRIQYTAAAGKVMISDETYNAIQERLSIAQEVTVCLKGVEDQRKLYEVAGVAAEYES